MGDFETLKASKLSRRTATPTLSSLVLSRYREGTQLIYKAQLDCTTRSVQNTQSVSLPPLHLYSAIAPPPDSLIGRWSRTLAQEGVDCLKTGGKKTPARSQAGRQKRARREGRAHCPTASAAPQILSSSSPHSLTPQTATLLPASKRCKNVYEVFISDPPTAVETEISGLECK